MGIQSHRLAAWVAGCSEREKFTHKTNAENRRIWDIVTGPPGDDRPQPVSYMESALSTALDIDSIIAGGCSIFR